jgi:hypothetical protein
MKTQSGCDLGPYRQAFSQMAIGAVVVEGAIDRSRVETIRQRLDAAGFSPFRLRHLGRYDCAHEIEEPRLFDELHRIAEYVTDASLVVTDHSALRLRQGDYLLSAAGEPSWPAPSRGYELTLDVSAGSSGEAQVVYARRGENFFVAPQLSGSITIVARGPDIDRYDRYLSHRVGDHIVHRLRLALVRSGVAQTAPPDRPEAPPSDRS